MKGVNFVLRIFYWAGRGERGVGVGGEGDKNKRIRNENIQVLIAALTVSNSWLKPQYGDSQGASKELTRTAKFEAVFHARGCNSSVRELATSGWSYTAPQVTQLQSQLVDAVQKRRQTLRATRAQPCQCP